jgi:menaquinone-dependent protoporphyrinogen oxidase
MMRVLIPYGTTEGLTARISEYVAHLIRGHGHEAETGDLKGSVEPEPDGYDVVIVGASIHMGKHEELRPGLCQEEPRRARTPPLGLVSCSRS